MANLTISKPKPTRQRARQHGSQQPTTSAVPQSQTLRAAISSRRRPPRRRTGLAFAFNPNKAAEYDPDAALAPPKAHPSSRAIRLSAPVR
jgi:hypothetical protein